MNQLLMQRSQPMKTPLTLGIATLFGEIAWLNSANLTNQISLIVGAATTLVLGYISISQMLDKRRHEKRKIDLEDEVARLKALDEIKKDTLTGQLGEMTENQEKMRQSLHAIKDELNARNLENTSLRMDLAKANGNFVIISNQLAEANRRILATSQHQVEIDKSQCDLTEKLKSIGEGHV